MDIIRTALLSYGASGKYFHAPFLNTHSRFQLRGAWERSRRWIAQDYAGVRSYTSLDAVLDDNEVELVVVNTPTHTHFQYAREALLAGKHVTVEKAFTTTVAEAQELAALAAQKGLMLSVFQNRRWDSDFSTVHAMVQSGRLGRLHTAEFSFLRYRPFIGPKLHFETPGPGAGLLNDLGPHLIDQAYSLFGTPVAMQGMLRRVRPASQVDDTFDIQLWYEGLQVRLYSSMMAHGAQPAYILHGNDGSFIKQRADRQEALLKSGARPGGADWLSEPQDACGELYSIKEGVPAMEKIESLRGSYSGYYDAVYKALREDAEPPVPAADGIAVMRIIEAARKSSETGATISFDALLPAPGQSGDS